MKKLMGHTPSEFKRRATGRPTRGFSNLVELTPWASSAAAMVNAVGWNRKARISQ